MYAKLQKRFLAFIIDGIFLIGLITVSIIITLLVLGSIFTILGSGKTSGGFDITTKLIKIFRLLIPTLSIVQSWLYFTLLESSQKQATFGKMFLGIAVTDLRGDRISFLRANARYWIKLASFITSFLLIGLIAFALAFFSKRNQTLHDTISGTIVVEK
jgi:uncharacterized RDD family membrane protein YckC